MIANDGLDGSFADDDAARLDAEMTEQTAPNLVLNGDLQAQGLNAPDQPAHWRPTSWGENAATFRYVSAPPSVERWVRVELTAHASGDAKWTFDGVTVEAGGSYRYTDRYRSNVDTKVVAAFTLTDGMVAYRSLAMIPASSDWTSSPAIQFVAPADAKSVSVFHLLASVGWLELDDVALESFPEALPDLSSGVPNGKLEQAYELFPEAEAKTPTAFRPNVWGVNDATFSYLDEGHASPGSLRVDIGAYASGAASWYFDEVPVVAGTTYRFSDFYRSDVDTTVIARVTSADGTIENLELAAGLASPTWRKYSADISVPSGAASLTVFHRLTRRGYLQTDDYALQAYVPRRFASALVSLTFDDSFASAYEQVLPILRRHGVVATHYVLTGRLDTPNRLSRVQAMALCAAGHQLGSHTIHHFDLTTLDAATLAAELRESKSAVDALGCGEGVDFASPFGAYSAEALANIRGLYATHRTTGSGYNTRDNFDPYVLKVQNLRATTTVAEVEAWAAMAAEEKSWLILVYHDVREPVDSEYAVTPSALDAHVAALRKHGLTFVTVRQAIEQLTPQL